MANNLSYQQARKIRKTSFTDLFVDQLAQKDTGVFGAIGKTLSLRTSAKIKGYKEKFDPLNIAKFLTFGSKLGPALYGKLMGRSQKDVDYFTNRTRAIKGGNNTADRIGPSPDTGMQGINEQLAKIYDFLKSSREDDTRHEELMSNTEEEQNTERQRRHRELLETLRKLAGNLGTTQITQTAEPQTNYFGLLMKMIKALEETVSNIMKQLLSLWNSIRILDKLRKLIPWLSRFAANPALIIPALIAGGLYYMYSKIEDNKKALAKAAKEGNIEDVKKYLRLGMGDEAYMYGDEDTMVKNELKNADTPESREALKKLEQDTQLYQSRDNLFKAEMGKKGYILRNGEWGKLTDSSKKPTMEELRQAEEVSKQKFDDFQKRQSSVLPKRAEPYIPPFMPAAMTVEDQDLTPDPVPLAPLSQMNRELNYPVASSNFGPDAQMAQSSIVNNLNSPKQNKGINVMQIAVRNPDDTFRDLLEQSVFG